MSCSSCGAELGEEADTCPACGATIGGGYLERGPAVGKFGRKVMYVDWAIRWILVALVCFPLGAAMLIASFTSPGANAGLLLAMGLLLMGVGLLGLYVTFLNFRKQ